MSKYARDGVPPEEERPDGIQRDPGVISPWMAWNLTKHGPGRHGWAVHTVDESTVRAIRKVETGEVVHVARPGETVGTVDRETARALVGNDDEAVAASNLDVGFFVSAATAGPADEDGEGDGGAGGSEGPWALVGREEREGRVYALIEKRDVSERYRVLPPSKEGEAETRAVATILDGNEEAVVDLDAATGSDNAGPGGGRTAGCDAEREPESEEVGR